MNRLIECVPNFSEGRDLAKVDAIVDAMSGVAGAWVLDRTSDADHNRSVITLAGKPEAVAEAVIRGAGKAAELIDMTRQTGVHPRIGATDVIPFVPLEGVSVEECVALARRVGQELWDRYRIPVYFYEAAATRPERVNLENVRKGQFEGLREEALRDPDRSPDIGEPRLHSTAGATAVGVRKLLIAYNIYLNTSDVSVAREIARAIRSSSGGLRHVKAIGVEMKTRGPRPSFHQLDGLRADASAPRVRDGQARSRTARLRGGREAKSSASSRARPSSFRARITCCSKISLPRKCLKTVWLRSQAFCRPRQPIPRNRWRRSGRSWKPCARPFRNFRSALWTPRERPCPTPEPLTNADPSAPPSAHLQAAFAAADIYERLVQLETMAAPSMLLDWLVVKQAAMAAARGALESAEALLPSLRDAGTVARIKSATAEIEAKLSGKPVTTGK